jgi:hypothetical protein
MNFQMRVHVLRTFITYLLVHINQKEKIALEILAILLLNSTLLVEMTNLNWLSQTH